MRDGVTKYAMIQSSLQTADNLWGRFKIHIRHPKGEYFRIGILIPFEATVAAAGWTLVEIIRTALHVVIIFTHTGLGANYLSEGFWLLILPVSVVLMQ
jgi:hypothetical protein